MRQNIKKGINLLEIMIIISVIIILMLITIPSLSNFRNERVLRNTTEDIISLLNEARNNTISSLNSNNYSVHFEKNKVVLFIGSNYIINEITNKQINLDSFVEIPTIGGINLNGGGSDVIFERMTGSTEKYGSITIRVISDTNRQQVISINKLGVVSKN